MPISAKFGTPFIRFAFIYSIGGSIIINISISISIKVSISISIILITYGRFSWFQFAKISDWGPQILEPLLVFSSKFPLKVRISQGLGPFFKIEALNNNENNSSSSSTTTTTTSKNANTTTTTTKRQLTVPYRTTGRWAAIQPRFVCGLPAATDTRLCHCWTNTCIHIYIYIYIW